MNKHLLFDILTHKEVARPAWVPFSGIHAGKLVGHSAKDVLLDVEKLKESLRAVHKLYQPDGMPIMFDLQVEAEILGCELMWYEDTVPSVISHPLKVNKKIPCKCLMPTKNSGRLPLVLEAISTMKKEIGSDTALFGLICGPFTLASHLRGTDLFMDMYDDANFVHELLAYCTEFIKQISNLYIEAGIDVIAAVDPLVSQISSDHFNTWLKNPYTDLFATIREKNTYSAFFVCGDATRNIEDMCKTKPDAISVDENIDMKAVKAITDTYNIAIGGNIPLTTVMLHGSQKDNMKYVIDLIDKLPKNNKNLIISPGCDMPYDTPIENTIGAAQAVLEQKTTRKLLEGYEKVNAFDIDVELPDYENLQKTLVEVFTLDSLSCAACTYMMAMATDIGDSFKDEIEVIEYKFTEKQNIARVVKMGIKNLPAIYINGELAFSSIIPSRQDFICKIKEKKR
jgi:uroporphyrinogen decarboxylase